MNPKVKTIKLTHYEKALAAQQRQRERNIIKVNSSEYKAKQLIKKKQQLAKQRERAKTSKPIKNKFAKNKQHSPAEQTHIKKVVALGCIVCRNLKFEQLPCEVHHLSSGGMGLRSSNFKIIGLCAIHHRIGGHGVAIHAGKETFESIFGAETELFDQVNNLINEN